MCPRFDYSQQLTEFVFSSLPDVSCNMLKFFVKVVPRDICRQRVSKTPEGKTIAGFNWSPLESCFEIFEIWTHFIQTPAHGVSKYVFFSNLLNGIFFSWQTKLWLGSENVFDMRQISEMKILMLTISHCIWQHWITQQYGSEIWLKTLQLKKSRSFFFSVIALNFEMQIKLTFRSPEEFPRSLGLVKTYYLITILGITHWWRPERTREWKKKGKSFFNHKESHSFEKCILSCLAIFV